MPFVDSLLSKQEAAHLRALDRDLLIKFAKVYPQAMRTTEWQNSQLQSFVKRKGLGTAALKELFALLERNGLFDLTINRRRWVDSDNARYVHTVARATLTDMWPMGTNYYLRDNVIIGAKFLVSTSAKYRKLGKELLLSGLNFMSSCAQLERFEEMIRSSSAAYRRNPYNWPYIFSSIGDNLSCSKTQHWSHKQDSWQILALYTLEALASGAITLKDLSVKNRRFLGLIVPFLIKVSFWKCENSGSWEEIPAVRSSVRAWEHRLIVKLGEFATRREFGFLSKEFLRQRRHLGTRWSGYDLIKAVEQLDRVATKTMVRDLPREAPGYKRRDPRFRDADATLIYLLELGYPEFLAQRAGKSSSWALRLEKKIVAQVLSLQDEKTGGIYRYADDTYQRSGFFRNLTVARLTKLYGAPSADASAKFAERDQVVPHGRKAAWTHFVWQLACWAGRRFEETGHPEYATWHEQFFIQGLKLVTHKSKSLDVGAGGKTRIIPIPAWRMPECYIADRTNDGKELIFPSPHTPLNWSIAEMLHAFEVRYRVLSRHDRNFQSTL